MTESAGWLSQIAENAGRYQELQRRLAGLAITESSRDGTVRVTVSTTGLLTDLVLTDRWQPVPLAQVAVQVMACVRQAQARIPELVRQAMAETVGAQDPAAQAILARTRERFPAAPPNGAAPPAGAAPPPRHKVTARPGRAPDDEDWDGGSILEDVEDGRR